MQFIDKMHVIDAYTVGGTCNRHNMYFTRSKASFNTPMECSPGRAKLDFLKIQVHLLQACIPMPLGLSWVKLGQGGSFKQNVHFSIWEFGDKYLVCMQPFIKFNIQFNFTIAQRIENLGVMQSLLVIKSGNLKCAEIVARSIMAGQGNEKLIEPEIDCHKTREKRGKF